MKHLSIAIMSVFCLVSLPLYADHPDILIDRTIGEIYIPEAPEIEELALGIRTDLLSEPFNTPPPVSIDTIREQVALLSLAPLLSDILYLLHRHELERDADAFSHYQRFYEEFRSWFLGESWPTQDKLTAYVAFVNTALSSGAILPELGADLIAFTTQIAEYASENNVYRAPARSVEKLALSIHTDLVARGTPPPIKLDVIKRQILLVEGHDLLNEALHGLHLLEAERAPDAVEESHLTAFYNLYASWFLGLSWPEQSVLHTHTRKLSDAVAAETMSPSLATTLTSFNNNVKNYYIMWLATVNDGGGLRGSALAAICTGSMLTLTALAVFCYSRWWKHREAKELTFAPPLPSVVRVPRQQRPDTSIPPPPPLHTPVPPPPLSADDAGGPALAPIPVPDLPPPPSVAHAGGPALAPIHVPIIAAAPPSPRSAGAHALAPVHVSDLPPPLSEVDAGGPAQPAVDVPVIATAPPPAVHPPAPPSPVTAAPDPVNSHLTAPPSLPPLPPSPTSPPAEDEAGPPPPPLSSAPPPAYSPTGEFENLEEEPPSPLPPSIEDAAAAAAAVSHGDASQGSSALSTAVLGPGAQRPKPLRVNVTGGRRRTADHTPTPPPSPDLHSRVRREVHMQLTLAEQQCPGAQEESERLAAEAQSGSGPHSADTGCSVM